MLETVLSNYRYTFQQLYSLWQQPDNAELLNIPTAEALNEGKWVFIHGGQKQLEVVVLQD